MSDEQGKFDIRAWQNGELCPVHGVPYCAPCMQTLIKVNHVADGFDAAIEKMRARIMDRVSDTQFYRPAKRNFFEDSRRRQFAASCILGENHIFVPLEFVIIGDEKKAWKADDDETRAILRSEHLWDDATPAWAQNFTPVISSEDEMLLREMQLFV